MSKLRNRVIGRVFHALGLIEQWGSGIQRMAAACREAGLAEPFFEELAARFRVTITSARVGRPVLDETDRASLESLGGGKGLATSEIAQAICLTPRAMRTRLARCAGRPFSESAPSSGRPIPCLFPFPLTGARQGCKLSTD